jgi:hypothetical protein
LSLVHSQSLLALHMQYGEVHAAEGPYSSLLEG